MTDAPTVHSDMNTSPGFTHAGSVVHAGPSMPNQPRTLFTSPFCPLNSSRNSTPTATGGVIFGRKNTVRKNPDARPARSSSRASTSETTTYRGTCMRTNRAVLPSASISLSSLTSWA